MNIFVVVHAALRGLPPDRRDLARWRRRSEAEAAIAAERIETARLLAGVASCQLRLAELDQGGPGAGFALAGPPSPARSTWLRSGTPPGADRSRFTSAQRPR
jgi:hypothetical protein